MAAEIEKSSPEHPGDMPAKASTKNVINIDPYNEGKRAYHQGKSWSDNPYAHMALSPHSYQWMCGWDDGSLEPLNKGRDHVYVPRNPVY